MRLKALIILALIVASFSASAQFTWPEDPEQRSEAQTLWTLFDDNYRQGNFDGAKPHLAKLLEKYPTIGKSLYINGIKVWDETFSNSKDAAVQKEAADMVMNLYDMRFENIEGQ